jgi:replicative DNA helicase
VQYTTSEEELARLVASFGSAVFGDRVRPTIRRERSWFQVYLNDSRERALRVAAAVSSEALRVLAESDIYWDQVASIEADGIDEVFDLTVPDAHNFVAEDVIVHNSIEQDADLVAFIYRDEIYNPSEENKGLAELIIAKHRNGETGTIELVFLGDTTSFRNLDRHGGPPPAPF